MIRVFENGCGRNLEKAATGGREIRGASSQQCDSLRALHEDAEVQRLPFSGGARALKMDEGSEKRLAGTGFSDDHNGLSASGESRNFRFEPCDCRTAAYDLGEVQSSSPEEADQVGAQVKGALAAGGLLDSGVSGTRGVNYLGVTRMKRENKVIGMVDEWNVGKIDIAQE